MKNVNGIKTCETFEENIFTTFIAFLSDFIDSNNHNFTTSLYKKLTTYYQTCTGNM